MKTNIQISNINILTLDCLFKYAFFYVSVFDKRSCLTNLYREIMLDIILFFYLKSMKQILLCLFIKIIKYFLELEIYLNLIKSN